MGIRLSCSMIIYLLKINEFFVFCWDFHRTHQTHYNRSNLDKEVETRCIYIIQESHYKIIESNKGINFLLNWKTSRSLMFAGRLKMVGVKLQVMKWEGKDLVSLLKDMLMLMSRWNQRKLTGIDDVKRWRRPVVQ